MFVVLLRVENNNQVFFLGVAQAEAKGFQELGIFSGVKATKAV